MIRFVVFLVWVSVTPLASAQGSLGTDLDRASSRYAPAASDTSGDVDRLVAEAGASFRNRKIDQAVAALDKAAGLAYTSGATGKAFELSLTAAEARRSQGRLLDAARRYRDQALTNPRDPRSAVAHFAACDAMAAISNPTPEVLAEYDQLLGQHATTWPTADTAAIARWRRIELLATRRQWNELLSAVRAIPKDDEHYERALDVLVSGHSSRLREDASGARFESARRDLEPMVLGSPPRWPDPWSMRQRNAALVLARGAIDQGDDGVTYARRLLDAGAKGSPLPSIAWQRQAAVLLIVAALVQGDTERSDAWLHDARFQLRPQERQRVLNATRAQITQSNTGSLAQQADALLRTLTELSSPEVTDNEASEPRAEALRKAGRDAEALQEYAELAKQRPDDRGVQVAYAELLSKSSSPSDRDLALEHWRAIEARTPPSTDSWFDARLARLRLMIDCGDREAAGKLLSLTRLLAPTLGGERLRSEFEALNEELGLSANP